FWDVIGSMLWFMLLFAWIVLIIRVFGDIFRDRTLSGAAKAFWVVLLMFLPWMGALIYLVVRGESMNERSAQVAQAKSESTRSYLKTAGRPSTAQELRTLAELRETGLITAEDYERAKAKALA